MGLGCRRENRKLCTSLYLLHMFCLWLALCPPENTLELIPPGCRGPVLLTEHQILRLLGDQLRGLECRGVGPLQKERRLVTRQMVWQLIVHPWCNEVTIIFFPQEKETPEQLHDVLVLGRYSRYNCHHCCVVSLA